MQIYWFVFYAKALIMRMQSYHRMPHHDKWFITYLCFAILCFTSVWIPPNEKFWWAGFLSLIIPFVAASFLLWFVAGMLMRKWWSWASILMLCFALFPLRGFFELRPGLPFMQEQDQLYQASNVLSVLSYNVRVFNVYEHLQAEDSLSSRQMLHWLSEHPAQVKCLQEIYNEDSSPVFNSVEQLVQNGKYYYYLSPLPSQNPYKKGYFGIGIFSVYPILNSDYIELGNRRANRAIFIDIQYGTDTIRIYNVHLASMSIEPEKINHVSKSTWIKDAFFKLKKGFIHRTQEQQILLEHIASSPYPVIVCGDFNALPHSYTYHTFRRWLHNSHESAGIGFGFTYANPPLMLRIDHQFFKSDFFKVMYSQVLRFVRYSDHYPLLCFYQKRAD